MITVDVQIPAPQEFMIEVELPSTNTTVSTNEIKTEVIVSLMGPIPVFPSVIDLGGPFDSLGA